VLPVNSAAPKPYSDACDRNRDPILEVLARVFATARSVLEIGSGTGQHAVHFARHLPHLVWQPSDVPENLPGIRLWCEEARLPNLRDPIALDVDTGIWPGTSFDAAFTANTTHIMAWPQVERAFEGLARVLGPRATLCVYGPFRYGGRHTAESNARFDASLRARDPRMGIRDAEAVQALAARCGFAFAEDNAMPANNRLLVWHRAEA
jgi:SAM-dependent methyltransferase